MGSPLRANASSAPTKSANSLALSGTSPSDQGSCRAARHSAAPRALPPRATAPPRAAQRREAKKQRRARSRAPAGGGGSGKGGTGSVAVEFFFLRRPLKRPDSP